MCCWWGGARPAQGAATTTDKGLVPTLERASLQVGCVVGVGVGARPAQGAATTTDEGLVRTFERASLLLGYISKQSNRTQVGTYLGASASEGKADSYQYIINVHQRPPTGWLFVVCGRSNERPYGQGVSQNNQFAQWHNMIYPDTIKSYFGP